MEFNLKSLKPRSSAGKHSPRGRISKKMSVGMAVPAIAALVGLAFAGTAAPSNAAEIAPVSATSSTTGWLHTDGGTIRDSNNDPYTIKAISWFGMETSDCMPHGLWGSLTIDDALANMKSMGFNTVRLPYSNDCLAATSIKGGMNYWANRAYNLEGKTPLDLMDTVIARAKANGLQIILDRHRPTSADQSPLWYTSSVPESKWISDWKFLADRYKNDPTVIGADLHNEPAGAATWGGPASTNWQAAATRGGNAVLESNPNLLILVEGIENQSTAGGTWWGGGLADVGANPVILSNPNRVVYSPHDYPSSLYAQKWFSDPAYPNNLPSVWDRNWGYIQKQGIAPVLLGEFGSALTTTSDQQWMTSIVDYLKTNNMSYAYWSFNPNSGVTGGIVKSDWKTWEQAKIDALAPILTPSPVSSPSATATPTVAPTATPTATSTPTAPTTTEPAPGTVGVVATAPTFWAGAYSIPTVTGVVYKVNGTVTAAGYYTDSSQITITAEAASGYYLSGTTSWSRNAAPVTTPTATPTPTPTATSTPTPTATPAPTTAPSTGGNVSSTWKIASSWGTGYTANLSITALADAKTWKVSWVDPYATSIANQWGMKCTVASPIITCVGTDWTTSLKKGQVVSAGVQVTSTKTPVNPVLSY